LCCLTRLPVSDIVYAAFDNVLINEY